jgi:ABC-type uncharacterized transport system ATPase subunit
VEAICERVIIINKDNFVADGTLDNLQKTNVTQKQVMVEFKEKINIESLSLLKDISNAQQLSDYSFQLYNENVESVKKILHLANKKNLNIVSIQSGGHNLEYIFSELTNS